MQEVDIKYLSQAFHLALLNDGALLSEGQIEQCIRGSLSAEKGAQHTSSLVTATELYLSFADISDAIGAALGHEIKAEGFALDWAEHYPSFRRICAVLQSCVVQIISYMTTFGREALARDVHHETAAEEIAAAMLELEQNKPIIH